jgi:hypothetical protein
MYLFQVGEMKIRAQRDFRFRLERDKRAETVGSGLIFAHTQCIPLFIRNTEKSK